MREPPSRGANRSAAQGVRNRSARQRGSFRRKREEDIGASRSEVGGQRSRSRSTGLVPFTFVLENAVLGFVGANKKPEYRLVPGMQNCNSFRFP